jgi:hypothetical protein
LRLLYILYTHFSEADDKIAVPEALVEPMVEFLLGNIFKFRKIFESPENYAIEIPSFSKSHASMVKPQAMISH